ncbi:MAG: hypothetical protein PHY16_17530 [Methylobacter sp.]|nr:hypothetical protein [Methylobacter sp.]
MDKKILTSNCSFSQNEFENRAPWNMRKAGWDELANTNRSDIKCWVSYLKPIYGPVWKNPSENQVQDSVRGGLLRESALQRFAVARRAAPIIGAMLPQSYRKKICYTSNPIPPI